MMHTAYILSDNHPADIEDPRTALAIATRAGTNTKGMEPGPLDQSSRDVSSPLIYML